MNYSGISVPSTFPASRRPTYVYPIASMSRKNRDNAYPQMAHGIRKALTRHEGDKILVHTVSYDLNNYLYGALRKSTGNLITYSQAQDKQKAVDSFIHNSHAVLLAPSLDRGIDLPQDNCRAIIICKIPFPSLGTKQISARLHTRGGQLWYNVRTVRSLIQMTGRGMRSEDDSCTSYILDKQFITLIWRKNRQLLPQWWTEALVWNGGTL